MRPATVLSPVVDRVVCVLGQHGRLKAVLSPEGSRRQGVARRTANRLRRGASTLPATEPQLARDTDPWFYEHYINAVDVIEGFLAADGLSLCDAVVADVGCGDGITDLGIVDRLQPKRLVGFDINPVNEDHLLANASRVLGRPALPSALEFSECGVQSLPADDVPYVQHRLREGEIVEHMRANPLPDRPLWHETMIDAFTTLNRITVDDLQRALREAGFKIRKAEFYTGASHIPDASQDVPLSALLVSGVKLLAKPS
jgi:SAM-dependent methyltransferase